jgi:glycosyltransferase involved in cell wall biosynthesis
MKTLFVGNPSQKLTDGGSATLHRSLRDGISTIPDALYITPTAGQFEVQHAVRKHAIDLVWFLSPYYEMPPAGVPFVTTVWDLGHRMLPYCPEVSTAPGAWTWEARESYYSHVLPRAARVITTCGGQLQECYGVRPENIRTIPLCVDVDTLRAKPDSSMPLLPNEKAVLAAVEPQKYLLYPAQFWPHKNHVTLIDMLKILQDRGHDFKLVFTGSDKGNQQYIAEYAHSCDMRDAVLFPGFVSTDVLHQLYRNAFACVYASLMGPDNLPPLEAMALDCPVICSDYPGAREQLGEAALYFNSLNAHNAADRVESMIDGPTISDGWRQTMIERGRVFVQYRTPDIYIGNVKYVLAELAQIRRLWGTGYRHL